MRKMLCVRDNRARFETEEGVIWDFPVSRVYAGIVSPNYPHSGYYLILAEHRDKNEKGKRRLFFLTERALGAEKDLFEKLTEDLKRFGCQDLFADQRQAGFWEALYKVVRYSGTSLIDAPYGEDTVYGKILILEARDMLKGFPRDSILASQLGELEEERIDEFLNTPSFYAVTALRFVLGGFKKYENWGQSGRREVVSSGYPYV